MSSPPPAIAAPRRRGVSMIRLTPLIDVIFILLIFFMLASTLETRERLPVALAADADGPDSDPSTELVQLEPSAAVVGNQRLSTDRLVAVLNQRLSAADETTIRLQPQPGVSLQRTLNVLATLRASGLTVSLTGIDASQ